MHCDLRLPLKAAKFMLLSPRRHGNFCVPLEILLPTATFSVTFSRLPFTVTSLSVSCSPYFLLLVREISFVVCGFVSFSNRSITILSIDYVLRLQRELCENSIAIFHGKPAYILLSLSGSPSE